MGLILIRSSLGALENSFPLQIRQPLNMFLGRTFNKVGRLFTNGRYWIAKGIAFIG